jgi:hypothetical protein
VVQTETVFLKTRRWCLAQICAENVLLAATGRVLSIGWNKDDGEKACPMFIYNAVLWRN